MRLEIVVAAHCRSCEEARAIARNLHHRLPGVDVVLIELDGQQPAPAGVVATPTYLLDGRVISLGNPRREWLLRELVHAQQRDALFRDVSG